MISLLLAIIVTISVNGPDKQIDPSRLQFEQLAEAYGYVVGQATSLELINSRFPELAGQVDNAWLVFEKSDFAQGFNGVETLLAEGLGEKWPKFQAEGIEKLGTQMSSYKLTREEAVAFLAEVNERAAGKIPDTIRATLLSAHPQYSHFPAKEFLDGWKQTFETKGHAKSKGANFRFSYPTSWTKKEGQRPNIVQEFQSKGGRGLEFATILTKDLPINDSEVITEQDRVEMFSPEVLRKFVPPNATFLDAQTTRIDGNPAGILEYTMVGESAGMTVLMRIWTINFLCKETFIQIGFSVGGTHVSEADISNRMAIYKPLFRTMANSIVLPDKWIAQPVAITPPSRANALMDSSIPIGIPSFSFLISAIFFSWVIGLTPPLVIRYAIARQPLSKRSASLIAAGWSGTLWIVGHVLIQAEGGQTGKITVFYFVLFGVSRWIISRGFIPTLAQRDGVTQALPHSLANG